MEEERLAPPRLPSPLALSPRALSLTESGLEAVKDTGQATYTMARKAIHTP